MKNHSVFRRLLAVVIVVAMLASMSLPAMAAQTDDVSFRKVSNDRVSAMLSDRQAADSLPEELVYSDEDVVRVSIFLDKSSVIDAGYPVEGVANNFFAKMYRNSLKRDQDKLVSKIEKTTGEALDVVWNLTLATNLISANVPYGMIGQIEEMAGVRTVVIETVYEPDVVSKGDANPNMATSGTQTGTAPAWAAGYTGAGSRIAIIDTGLDVDHEAFNAAAYQFALESLAEKKGMTAEEYTASLDLLDAEEIAGVLEQLNAYQWSGVPAEALYVNSKVPFGFNYAKGDLDLTHANNEHGSHVAGIAAANAYVPAEDGFVSALDTTFVQGVAPNAQLLVMNVFGSSGASQSDYMAAIEDAILLGADSVNLSLGSSAPGMTYASVAEYQSVMDSLEKSGVVVSISAGNSGYWAEMAENGLPYLYLDDVSMQTGGSPGSYVNSLGVASVDNAGFTALCFFVGGKPISYHEVTKYGNAPIITVAGEQEYVFLNGIGTEEQFDALPAEVLTGKVVLCYRGETSFFEKANAAVAKGAKAVIIVNNVSGLFNMDLTGYEYTAPVVLLTLEDGEQFKANGTAVAAGDGSIWYWTGKMEISDGPAVGFNNTGYDAMSVFSSWGVPGSLIMKPEITAPGGNIYSVAGDVANTITGHNNYEQMSGTSMAAPQVAGMAAVLAQYIKEAGLEAQTGLDARTLSQSLLMSTAVPLFDIESGGNYYPVLQQGAGLANVGAAITADSYILMLEDATASYADGKVKAELGDDPEKKGVYSFSFTINNLTGEEKTFVLSADVFTQDAFAYSGVALMDTWTRLLSSDVSWVVNGKAVNSGAALAGLDFNGDGLVNTADGQALLDYATGVRTELTNKELADLNTDGIIGSYDAYLFLSMLGENGAVVPANGSATVTVTIALSEEDKAWLANYENGAYVEAFVYAQSLSTAEGVSGTCHSIPVLGFYGNWSDASMYDKGSYIDYQYGYESRPPYMYKSIYRAGGANGLTITYAGDPTEYWFGGNPMVMDEIYMPERNAINSINGDAISSLGFTSIRNAAAAKYQVWNSQTGEYYIDQIVSGALTSAYFNDSMGVWQNTYQKLSTYFTAAGIPNNTPIEMGITLALEYYLNADGSVNWDALGKGATFSMPMVVDNDAPVLGDLSINQDLMGDEFTLDVVVTDNQYIAAIALYDIYGQYLYTYAGSVDQAAGDTVSYSLDLSEVNGPSFLLQVYDYAMNTTTYEIKTQIGELTDEIESVEVAPTELVMQKGNTETLTAIVYPVNATSRDVVWSSSDESVVTVDANGVVAAVGAGTAVVTATAAADETKSASCAIEVIDISAELNGIVWDENGSIWYSKFNTADLPYYEKLSHDMLADDYIAAACTGPDGMIYACSLDTTTASGAMYIIDPVTYEVTKLTDCIVQGLHVFYSDLTFAPGLFGTGCLLGTYGPYVIAIDPANGEALGVLAAYENDLLGIASCYGYYDPEANMSLDAFYLVDNAGNLIQEMYAGLYDYDMIGSYASATLPLGIDKGDAWYFNSLYYDASNAVVFWSAFNQNTDNNVTLYAIDEMADFRVYNLGQFADDVWPVAGLHQNVYVNDTEAAQAKLAEVKADIAINGMPEMKEYQLVKKDMKVNVAAGGLNAVSGANVRPMSAADVDAAEDTVTVTITAEDVSTNGVTTVTYDPEALTLLKVGMGADYTSINEAEGTVTVGYVQMEGYAADDVVATLVFTVKNTDTESVTVTYEEINDEIGETKEDVEIDYPHANTEIKDVKDATCTEEGYTGDTYCTDCGKLIAKGEVIPATGHGETEVKDVKDATCTEEGYTGDTYCTDCGNLIAKGEVIPATGHGETEVKDVKDATCTEEGYTGDTYCTDCGDKIADGEATEALGHKYESVVTKPTVDAEGYTTHTCTECGHSYMDSYVPKVDPENPKTSQDHCTALLASMALMTAAAAAVVVMLSSKKKLF